MTNKLIFQFEDFSLDPGSHSFFYQNYEIKLEPRVFEVLHLMLQRPNEIISKDEFFEYVWQGKVVSDWALSRAIKVLRKTLQEYSKQEIVKTLYGKGYLFSSEVNTIPYDEFLEIKKSAAAIIAQHDNPKESRVERESQLLKGQEAELQDIESTLRNQFFKPIILGIGALTILAVYFIVQELNFKETKIDSIVVLPIVNINGKPNLDYLSNGLTDVITGHLAQNRNLRVISRTSAQYYQNKNITPAEIATKLNVDGIIEGSIFLVNDKLHMNVRLISAKSKALVWSFEEEGTLSEIYSFFQKTALKVGLRVSPQQPISEQHKNLAHEKTDRETFELYLKAKYLLNSRQGKYLQDAATLLKKAISKDESFADAHASLAAVYIVMSSYTIDKNIDPFLLAKQYNDKALQLDPNSSLAWTNLGLIEFGYNYNFQAAQDSFEKAIELDPNNVDARRAYSELLAIISEYNKALSILEETWRKDTMNPLLIAVWGSTLMMDRQYQKALEKFELAKSLGSEMIWIDRDIAYIYQRLGNIEQSFKYRYFEMNNIGYFKNGDKEFIEATTQRGYNGFWHWRLPILEKKWQENTLHACNLSEAYGGIGDFNKMLHWFKLGLEQKSENCFQLVKRSPEFYKFKDEREFKALLSKYDITL